MSNRWTYLFLACLPLLPGCLQVELRGPVAGATVTITALRGGDPLVSELTTSTTQQVKQ